MLFSQEFLSPLIQWLEKEVSIENHQDTQKRLSKEILSYAETNIASMDEMHKFFLDQAVILINKKSLNINNFKFTDIFVDCIKSKLVVGEDFFLKDDDLITMCIELLILVENNHNLNLKIDKESQIVIKNGFQLLLENSSWVGSKPEVEKSQIVSKLSFLLLNTGALERDYIESVIEKLILFLPPDQWFKTSSQIYGKSFLLRSIINLCANNPEYDCHDYLKNVCEHLLKRMEIRREIMVLSTNNKNDASICLLEQLRINIAVLESGVFFNDLRFLNAAMKSNDRIYDMISKIKISSKKTKNNINNIAISLHYNKIINLQEKIYESLI